ncbi:cilia- and flagella-associated protein 99-like, partial [Augochlora pura]
KLQKNLKEVIETTKHSKKKVTVPVFMNVLNHPKRIVGGPPGTPEDLVVQRSAREVPRTNYVKPSTEKRLEALRAANKSQAIRLLNDANENAPKLLLREKRPTEAKVQEKSRPIFLRKPVPTFKAVEVKQTTASILRECARVITDEEKEIKKLKLLAEGGFDPSSIVRVEEEERERKKLYELSKIEEKRLLALISREGAFIAKQSLLNDCKQQAECVRRE